jgi:hypothetical protein
LQLAGDFDLAYQANILRVRADALEDRPVCQPCEALDAVLAWLRPPQPRIAAAV